jgi:SAM-dependent methyltransferase
VRIRARRECWDLIKRYYPVYEGKGPVFREFLEEHLDFDLVLVDVGCGRGKETVLNYKEEMKCSIGMDLSAEISKNPTVHHRVVGDAIKIPLRNGCVDVVVCQELVEHLKDPAGFFQEVSRVLRRNGQFIIMTPNLLGWRSLVSRLTPYWFHKAMNKRLHDIEPSDVFPTYYRANTYGKAKRVLQTVGLEVQNYAFFEPSPRTLTFSKALVSLEILYTKALRKYAFLSSLRETIILRAVKR